MVYSINAYSSLNEMSPISLGHLNSSPLLVAAWGGLVGNVSLGAA